jgi:hypothetical protein
MQYPVDFPKEIGQQPGGVYKLAGNALSAMCLPMLVVIRQMPAGVLESLRRFGRMGVIEAHDPLAVGFVRG